MKNKPFYLIVFVVLMMFSSSVSLYAEDKKTNDDPEILKYTSEEVNSWIKPPLTKAVNPTYIDYPATECEILGTYYYSYPNNVRNIIVHTNVDNRYIVIRYRGTNNYYYTVYAMVNTSTVSTSFVTQASSACPESWSTQSGNRYQVDGVYYNVETKILSNVTQSGEYPTSLVSDYIIELEQGSYSTAQVSRVAIEYTYGQSAVAPDTPQPEPGTFTFNYYTDFASPQSYSIGGIKSNRDTITWDYSGGDISNLDLKVDIRAVPTNYYAASEDVLTSLGWSDLHLDLSYASDLGSYQINNGSVSYTWEQVVNNFAVDTNLPEWMETVMDFWSKGFYKLYNNLYYAAGWVYQIRLNTWSGDYTGEWQTIYTVPAAPPEGQQQTINYYVNGTGITEPIYQTIQNINQQNNITNNTWYVNGAPVDVDESSEGESWLEKLVKMIWNFITSIFQFNDTDLTIPDWDLNIQNLKDNTGIFGQSIQAIDQIKLRFDELEDAQPVFSFPGFSLDDVQLIPSFSINLNDVVEDMGLEGLHNTELVIMDGVVYLSLILFAKAQLERILKK